MSQGSRDPDAPDAGDAPKVVALNFRGREVVLLSGKYFVGRSNKCHVVIEDQRISRRHARLDVYDDSVSITDLGSANGVKINGVRVLEGAHELRNGDVVELARERLRIRIRDAGPQDLRDFGRRVTKDTLTGLDSTPPSQEPRPELNVPTRFSDEVELVFKVAEKGLEAGNPENAAGMVREHLKNLLADAQGPRKAPAASYALATNFALRLAWETGAGEWFDYAIEMLRLREVACSDQLADRLATVLHRVDAVDIERLRRYGEALRGRLASMDSLRAAQRVEELVGAAGRKQWKDPRRG